MVNEKINIVMFNMSTFWEWDHGIVNRNLNVLQAIAEDPRVEKIVSVDFLPTGFRKTAGHYLRNILFEAKTAEMIYGDLTSACYRRTDKIYTYTTIDSAFSMKIVANELKRVEKILNLKNIVFWSFNPMFVEFIGKLNEKLFVFDTVDNWTEHPGYTKLMQQKRLFNNYQTIATKADVIFTVSEELKEFYKQLGRKSDVQWIPNGVDYAHFNDPALINKENELTKIKKPIIGYLGTIQDRVDLDLIVAVANAHQDKEIVLCGPILEGVKHEVKEKLGKLKNVRLTGRIKFEDAPSYVSRFDVAIIPHKINEFVKSMNPMKMYDYLAAGKPIVSTPCAGLDMFKDFIYIAKDAKAFIKYIDQAIKEDSSALQAKRRAAVKSHSWENRARQMLDAAFNKLGGIK